MQKYDFKAGSDFVNEMYEASKEHPILVVLPSQYSDSTLCINQWDAAFKKQYNERERKLIFVRNNACQVEGTRGPITCIDLVGLDRVEAATRLFGCTRGTEYPIEKFPCPVTLTTPSPGFPSVFPDIWNISHRRSCHFTGRDEIIEQLHESLSSSGSALLYISTFCTFVCASPDNKPENAEFSASNGSHLDFLSFLFDSKFVHDTTGDVYL